MRAITLNVFVIGCAGDMDNNVVAQPGATSESEEVSSTSYTAVFRSDTASWCEGAYTHVRVRCYTGTGYTEAVRPLEEDEVFSGFHPDDCTSLLVHVNMGNYEDGHFSPNTSMENLYDTHTGNRSITVIAGDSEEDDEFEEYDLLDPLPCADFWDPDKGLGYGPYAMERECGDG